MSDTGWTEVTIVVPSGPAERMADLARASGVSFDAFVAASLELRLREHEGLTELVPALAEIARKLDADRAAR